MCGISAVVDMRPDGKLRAALLLMHEALAHRGPDGEGYLWLDSQLRANSLRGEKVVPPEFPPSVQVAAAFRWLKIQDLDSAANQPMSSFDGAVWLLFNGEIYNHSELRAELQRAGFEFRTRSDTEVILAAYRHWGSSCLARFRGMWAIVLIDLNQRRVFISRDRLGIKPLFYSLDRARLLIASEAKAVALARVDGPRAEPFRAHEFLRGLPPQAATLTFFRDVYPVPAGTWAEFALDSDKRRTELMFHPYWNLADYRMQDIPEALFERKRDEFESILRAAMREHSIAAVEVGTLLSGGLDTSMLAHLLAENARLQDKPAPKAFSIIYEDPEMSEWPYMQLVIAKAGLRGVNHTLTPNDAWKATKNVVLAEGQPLLGQDIVAQYYAYKLARQHGNTVVLDGQGADELLAGMPFYEAQIFPELLFTGRWTQFVSELSVRMHRYGYGLREALNVYLRSPLGRKWMEMRGLPKYDWLVCGQMDSSRFGPGRTNDWGPESSALTRFLYRHVRHTNLPQVLMLQDHASMSHSIESRVPFLDHRLVEFIFQLPDSFKVHLGVRKRVLLETARRYLPKAVIERRDKRVFVSKVTWMELRGSRATELRDMAASDEMRTFGLVDPKKVKMFVSDYLSGKHNDEMAVWRLYTFWQWLCLFRPGL